MLSKARFEISEIKVLEEFNKLKIISDIVAYSVKSNPYISSILETRTNSMFLLHHINELRFIKDYSKVIFMLHSPESKELDFIFEKKINTFIVDNINDLESLLNYIKVNKKEINLLLRMRLKEYTVSSGKYFIFGFYSEQINDLIPKLKENKNILELGIHFHRKTQNLSEWNIINELEDSLSNLVFENIDYIDIGGGIPINYKNISSKAIDSIYIKIKKLKDYFNKLNIRLIIEPGRRIAGPSGKLITTIRNIVDNNIFIDASVFNCSMDTIVSHIKLLVENEEDDNESSDGKGKGYLIKGLTPASEDIFRYRVYFKKPYTPKIGDKIIFLNAGAYIYYTDLFNLERPEIKFVKWK